MVGVLLCGGSSTRFGSDKLLAGDPPIVSRAARNLAAAVERSMAVVPLGAERLRRVLENAGCEVIESDRTARGMGASLAAGIEATARASGWIIALGDMPAIRPETIRAVREALERGATIAAPVDAEGRRGHPVGFAASVRDELLALDGDSGAREVVQRHKSRVNLLSTHDPGILVDIDTPQDLEKL